ncbi:hypothetical protein P171DRAFT_447788 [Karstenula rhodostoma CBS 690.94]|uniref:Uncharacterized protein n=1 Tax=Karstenula rhodostoma CBS 690.94 TaxID=1392251 RepID=A0A9P4PAV0_9PLEO|nr:hypothetical protein P171DRAFT_447788 [Karstenula rhodostoma CBS 690.94]
MVSIRIWTLWRRGSLSFLPQAPWRRLCLVRAGAQIACNQTNGQGFNAPSKSKHCLVGGNRETNNGLKVSPSANLATFTKRDKSHAGATRSGSSGAYLGFL